MPGAGRFVRDPVRRLVELRKHEIPKLNEPAGVVARLHTRAVLFAEIVVQLAGRPTRTLVAGGPPEVILITERNDALPRHANLVVPYSARLFVRVVNGHPYPRGVDLEHDGREFPRPGNSLPLEVVADAEVAQHLEYRVVGEIADDINIGRAEALLGRRESYAGRRLVPCVVRLERHHACRSEQQRRIPGRYERRARHEQVAALLEEAQISSAYVVPGEGGLFWQDSHPRARDIETPWSTPRPDESLRMAHAACQSGVR